MNYDKAFGHACTALVIFVALSGFAELLRLPIHICGPLWAAAILSAMLAMIFDACDDEARRREAAEAFGIATPGERR